MLGAITMIMVGQCYGFYDSALAITPGIWFRKGTPAMLVTLIVSSLVFYYFFDFFNAPLP